MYTNIYVYMCLKQLCADGARCYDAVVAGGCGRGIVLQQVWTRKTWRVWVWRKRLGMGGRYDGGFRSCSREVPSSCLWIVCTYRQQRCLTGDV